MRKRVLGVRSAVLARSGAILALAALAAGCSSDVARFDDGFYTGAVPQAVPATQMAAGNYSGVDGMNTGSINSYPSGGYATQGSAPAGTVSSSQLPPPGGSAAPYGGASGGYANAQGGYSSAPYGSTSASVPSASAPAASESGRGAPPSTLGQQAAQIAGQNQSATQASAGSSSSVTVQSGDTLSSISRRTGVPVAEIRRLNGMSGDTIRLGQKLSLPSGTAPAAAAEPVRTAAVDAGTQSDATLSAPAAAQPQSTPAAAPAQGAETLSSKSGRVAAPETQAAPQATSSVETESRDVAAIAPQSTGISQFRWPVQGRVLSRFGERVDGRRNDGLNISVPRGTPVRAAENGVVIYSGDGLKEFGNTVLVKHDNGLVTVYGHADELKVKRGDEVKRGQEIASSGMSGKTSVPVLHFEVRKDSTPVDPSSYLN